MRRVYTGVRPSTCDVGLSKLGGVAVVWFVSPRSLCWLHPAPILSPSHSPLSCLLSGSGDRLVLTLPPLGWGLGRSSALSSRAGPTCQKRRLAQARLPLGPRGQWLPPPLSLLTLPSGIPSFSPTLLRLLSPLPWPGATPNSLAVFFWCQG